MTRTWQDSPTITLAVGSVGRGDLVITSAATLYFNAQTNGRGRPEVGLTVRGVRYLVSAHLRRREEGDEIFWDYDGANDYDRRRHLSISRADDNVVSDAARRTIAAMLLDAVRAWGQDDASQKLLIEGQARSLNNDLMRKEDSLAEKLAEVGALRDEIRRLQLQELAITGGVRS